MVIDVHMLPPSVASDFKSNPHQRHDSAKGMASYFSMHSLSAVPKRSRSKRSRTQKHAHARNRAQMSAKERKRAKERKNCKKPGLGIPKLGQHFLGILMFLFVVFLVFSLKEGKAGL